MQSSLSQFAKGRSVRQSLAKFRRVAAYSFAIGIGAALLALVAYLFGRFIQWQGAISAIQDVKDRIELENDVLKNLFQMVAGSAFLLGLYFTWRNFRLSQVGQITQRFNDAIEHLGSDKGEVRLGGIYALARISRDSPRDHMPVMRIFSLFVREATTRKPLEPVAAEVQAILAMIANRHLEYEGEADVIDLSEAYIPAVDFSGAQLEGVRLVGTNLSRAQLESVLLRGSNLRGAILEGAYLRNADMRNTDIVGADLRNASLRGARLDGADIAGARFDGAVLMDLDLSAIKNATRQQIESAITDETTIMPVYDEFMGA